MVNLIAGRVGQRLLSSPSNTVSLLKPFGYQTEEVEGEASSSGHITRAHRVSDDLAVVVKCIRRASTEARVLASFREVQTRGEILPVPPVLDLISDSSSDTILAVQEDWGRTLAELGPLSPPDFFNILGQCFEAVALLHAKGFAHLDISCYNFLCNSRQKVALIDFETSHRTNPDPQNPTRPRLVYPRRTTETPPEFRTPGAYTRRHCAYKLDIFALGVLILRFAKVGWFRPNWKPVCLEKRNGKKASGFDCPQLVLLAEPLIGCDPVLRPTAAEAVVWFQRWCERVGVAASS